MSSLAKRFLPLLDRVLVQKIKPDVQTKSGLFLPDSAKGPVNQAKVVAVGPGRVSRNGDTISCSVKVGDTVVVPEFGGMTLKLESEELHVFRDEDLIGILKDN